MRKLERMLSEIDRKSYPAYKGLKGTYGFQNYELCIEHVQGDPFAAPSRLSIRVKGNVNQFPKEMYDEKYKRIALQDYLLRGFHKQAERYSNKARGSGKSGIIQVTRCGQEVLERTGCEMEEHSGDIIVRFSVGFPANGRTINTRELQKILFEFLPQCVGASLLYGAQNKQRVAEVIHLAEDQQQIREVLKSKSLLAFIADGSILPRESGVKQGPMRGAVAFVSPESVAVEFTLPNRGKVRGMGIEKGITLIVGGGYHGKSTVLQALERGVYNHILGDGREYVITDEHAIKIKAEDGRSVKAVDISAFIRNLPNKKDTQKFYTEDASGSTSQAATVIESVRIGASALLIDEDTSATNFMVRDELMKKVIANDKEPIIPFLERARELHEIFDVSTIMVAGSSGSYFHIADTIIQMDEYEPRDITIFAKRIAADYSGAVVNKEPLEIKSGKRVPRQNPKMKGNDRVKTKSMGTDGFTINNEHIDLRLVDQVVDQEQMNALGVILHYMEDRVFNGQNDIDACVDVVVKQVERQGMAAVTRGGVPGNLSVPRREEIFACLNRYRGLNM